MPAMAQLYVGTSGFGYDEWRGRFYPEDIRSAAMLGYYAGVFNSVEVIYTFRQFPAEKTLCTWLEQTPEHFRFAIKAHRMVTHAASRERALAGMADFLKLYSSPTDRPYIIDVRPKDSYDQAHIKGAVSIPETDVPTRLGELPKDKLIVTYCD